MLPVAIALSACAGASAGGVAIPSIPWQQMYTYKQGASYIVGGPIVSGARTKHEALTKAMDAAAVEFLRYSGVDLQGETRTRTSQTANEDGVTNFSEEYSMNTRSMIRGVLRQSTAKEQKSTCSSGIGCEPSCSAAVLLQVPSSEFDRLIAERTKGPPLTLLVAINKKEFRPGDPVTITLTSSRDAHVSVFAIDNDKNWQRLFPNSCSPDGRLRQDEELVLPDAKMRAVPCEMVLLAQLPKGHAASRETFQVVATCDPLGDLTANEAVRKGCEGRDAACCVKKVISYRIVGH